MQWPAHGSAIQWAVNVNPCTVKHPNQQGSVRCVPGRPTACMAGAPTRHAAPHRPCALAHFALRAAACVSVFCPWCAGLSVWGPAQLAECQRLPAFHERPTACGHATVRTQNATVRTQNATVRTQNVTHVANVATITKRAAG
eukprot:365228-Chlamydomonas_euryale.AAC.6